MMRPHTFKYRTDGGTEFESTIRSERTGYALWLAILNHATDEIDAENERYGRSEMLVSISLERWPFPGITG